MEGTFSATASGALQWRDSASTFDELVVADLYDELYQEVGVQRADVELMVPCGLCREFLRGGKPQLFFAGLTSLTEQELVERRSAARIREAHESTRKVEVEDRHLDFSEPDAAQKQIRKHGINPEAAVNMLYAKWRFEN
jgi:hypothetical protein